MKALFRLLFTLPLLAGVLFAAESKTAQPTFVKMLKASGYQTAVIGKCAAQLFSERPSLCPRFFTGAKMA